MEGAICQNQDDKKYRNYRRNSNNRGGCPNILYCQRKECRKSTTESEVTSTQTTTVTASSAALETRLAAILSEINGAGKVNVLITYYSTSELLTAATTNTHSTVTEGISNKSSTTSETTSPIIVGNDVIVLKEIMPEVKGVIVVAEGASDVRVRLELLRAVQTVLEIDANAIEIFAGK